MNSFWGPKERLFQQDSGRSTGQVTMADLGQTCFVKKQMISSYEAVVPVTF